MLNLWEQIPCAPLLRKGLEVCDPHPNCHLATHPRPNAFGTSMLLNSFSGSLGSKTRTATYAYIGNWWQQDDEIFWQVDINVGGVQAATSHGSFPEEGEDPDAAIHDLVGVFIETSEEEIHKTTVANMRKAATERP